MEMMAKREPTRTDLFDTSPASYRKLVDMLRDLPLERKLQMVFDRIEMGRRFSQAGSLVAEKHAEYGRD